MRRGYDFCACGNDKRTKNKRCAKCRGYGTFRHLTANGYVRVYDPHHPLANSDGQVLEHRKVLHDSGVSIPAGAHVHHRNGDKTDNRLANLAVVSPSEHGHLHRTSRTERACEACATLFWPWKRDGRFCSRVCANRREVAT